MYNAGYRLWIEVANDVDTDRAAVDAKRLVVASIRTQYRMDSARTLNAVAASIEKERSPPLGSTQGDGQGSLLEH